MSRLQGRAHFLLQSADRAQADGGLENVGTDLLGGPLGQMVLAGQISERGGKLRTATVSPNMLGNTGPCDFTAAGTGASLPLIFRDQSYQRRQFGDLMACRRRIVRTGIRRQRRLAFVAVLRDNGDDARHPLGGQQFLQMRRVAGLSARLASGGLFHDRLGRVERIGRRGHRGIGGIVAEPSKQIANERLQLGDTPLQNGNAPVTLTASWTQRDFHADSLATRLVVSCASLQGKIVNGYYFRKAWYRVAVEDKNGLRRSAWISFALLSGAPEVIWDQ